MPVACQCLRCAKERAAGGGLPVAMNHIFRCTTCGFKNCPHSDDHRNACSGSDAPGQVGSRYAAPQALSHESLSARELAVFTALSEGYRCTEIAEQLKLSIKTVSTYRMRAMKKMGMRHLRDIILYAAKHFQEAA